MPLIRRISLSFTRCPDEQEDLIQTGRIVVWRLLSIGYGGVIATQLRRELYAAHRKEQCRAVLVSAVEDRTERKPGPFELRVMIAEAKAMLDQIDQHLLALAVAESNEGMLSIKPRQFARRYPTPNWSSRKRAVRKALQTVGLIR